MMSELVTRNGCVLGGQIMIDMIWQIKKNSTPAGKIFEIMPKTHSKQTLHVFKDVISELSKESRKQHYPSIKHHLYFGMTFWNTRD